MQRAQEAQLFTVGLQSPIKITQWDSLRELEKYLGDTNPYLSTELRGTVGQSRGRRCVLEPTLKTESMM